MGSRKGSLAETPELFFGRNVGPTTSNKTFMRGKYFHAGTGSPIACVSRMLCFVMPHVLHMGDSFTAYIIIEVQTTATIADQAPERFI